MCQVLGARAAVAALTRVLHRPHVGLLLTSGRRSVCLDLVAASLPLVS